MNRRCLHKLAGSLALIALCCGGCAPLWSLVIPEQRRLEIRDEAALPRAPLPPSLPPETVTNPVPAVVKQTELSLDEAIRIALANSQVVRILAGVTAVSSGQTIYDPAIANTQIDEARSVFDPAFFLNNTRSRSEQPNGILDSTIPFGVGIFGPRVDDYTLDLGLAKRNILGGTAKLDFTDRFSRFHHGVFLLNPQDRSALTMSYTQPLLRGAGVAANVAPIVIGRINTERSYFQFKDSVQELVRGVIQAYWNVAFAHADVASRQQQVEQAEEAYKIAEAKARIGTFSAAPVAQAKAALANFRGSLVSARSNLLQREAALRNIMGLGPSEPVRIELTTEPKTTIIERDWEALVSLAETYRPDLIELKLILEADQQAVLLADNLARPQVDAALFYRWNGLEGRTPSGANIETGPGQFTDWSVGVNFSVPLGLRKDRAGLRKAELIVKRDEANLDQGLHAAVHNLAASVRNLAQFHEQYLAFKEAEIASETNYLQQKKLYETGAKQEGKGVIYLDVLQAISSLGDARSAKAQALAQYNTELANLERETGTILETHGVRFFEERLRSIGPMGRMGPMRPYPASVSPGPNEDRYTAPPP